ncbi:hypothetical protein TVAG_165120 [Trichomonas vaginalis G3]|uniref:Uncharacterized protein n=1 Tax=Trichomonas vaginalis (strain ATCC PRA-98 / G3) TaxID=412133 RepID=A2DUJ3_TRIV3|nr:hypothetical protein TVAG_165120 [Trichomonas vaginalis G3]|eukprot:XP_001328107.1 hypothetical protein [Trichomonas vaginalis G3]
MSSIEDKNPEVRKKERKKLNNYFNENYRLYPKLSQALINNEFKPWAFLLDIYEKNLDMLRREEDAIDWAVNFAINHQDIIFYLYNKSKEPEDNDERELQRYYDERIKNILNSAALYSKKQYAKVETLRDYLKYQLLGIPNNEITEERLKYFQSLYDKYHKNEKAEKKKNEMKGKNENFKMNEVDEEINEEIKKKEKVFKSSPWRSKNQLINYGERMKWGYDKVRDKLEEKEKDSFDLKGNKKYYMKAIGAKGTFIIDYFISDVFVWLLVVEMNTRRTYAILSSLITKINSEWKAPKETKENMTALNTIQSLNSLIINGVNIKHIVCDQEPAFTGNDLAYWCIENGITLRVYVKNKVSNFVNTNEESRGNHSTLSILDRICRTLRTMNYNAGYGTIIYPEVMEYLVDEYNNSPNTSFTKFFKHPVSPNMMTDEMEREWCLYCAKMNFITHEEPNFDVIGQRVRIYNEANGMDKLKNKLLEGVFRVNGKESGLFVCESLMTGDVVKGSSWM